LCTAAEHVLGRKIILADALIRDAFSPEKFAATRTSPGGIAPRQIAQLAIAAHDQLSKDTDLLAAINGGISRAGENLQRAARTIVESEGGQMHRKPQQGDHA
jgi:hypothetical protein